MGWVLLIYMYSAFAQSVEMDNERACEKAAEEIHTKGANTTAMCVNRNTGEVILMDKLPAAP